MGGLADGTLDLVATDHVPDRQGVEKAEAASGVSFDRISNGAPGIETLLTLVYSEGVARGRITLERMVELLPTTPARTVRAGGKGALEVGRDADIVVFDPAAGDAPGDRPPSHERLHAVRGTAVTGPSATSCPRRRRHPRWLFVGRRGAGKYVERGPIAG